MKTAILAFLSAIPRWVWFLLAGAILIASILIYGSMKQSAGYTAGYEKKTAEIEAATAIKNNENRQKEHDLNDQIASLQSDNKKLRDQAVADQRELSARVGDFRLQLEKTRKLLADAAGSADPSVSTGGKTAYQTAVLLSDLLEKSLQRSSDLAAYADDAGDAGRLCEKQYDAARATVNAR